MKIINHNQSFKKTMKSLSFWCKFVGYLSMVAGIITVISGLIPLVIPALLGLIPIFLGFFLLKAGKKADEFLLNTEATNLEEMLEYLSKYFKLNGIYMIASLLAFFLLLILTIVLIGAGVWAVGDFSVN